MKVITDTLEVSRSNQYERGIQRQRYQAREEDERYLGRIRTITDGRPTYGYRRVTAVLNRIVEVEGAPRVNGLLLPKHTGKPVRTHDGTVVTLKSNLRWCSDGMEIPCWNGERIRVSLPWTAVIAR